MHWGFLAHDDAKVDEAIQMEHQQNNFKKTNKFHRHICISIFLHSKMHKNETKMGQKIEVIIRDLNSTSIIEG